jgi:methylglutamate dehydrogenase subunit B
MLLIRCPFCGPRDEAEFRYKGDADAMRPVEEAGRTAFQVYVYERDNPSGWHTEWWLHAAGCRQMLKVVRHTVTHRIHAVGLPGDKLSLPDENAP